MPFCSILINFRWQAIWCFVTGSVITTVCEKVPNSITLVYGPCIVYTTVYTAMYKPCSRLSTGRVHGPYTAVNTACTGPVHGRLQGVYTAVYADRVHRRVHRWDIKREPFFTSSTTFTQCAPQGTEFGEITQNKGHYVVQFHSRSLILVAIESSYTTSY